MQWQLRDTYPLNTEELYQKLKRDGIDEITANFIRGKMLAIYNHGEYVNQSAYMHARICIVARHDYQYIKWFWVGVSPLAVVARIK